MNDHDADGELDLPSEGRLAGVDYGTVRIGIAISDPGQIFASPFTNYTRQDTDRDAAYLRDFTEQESIVGFVVGLPIHLSGDESPKSIEARKFGAWLAQLTDRPITYYDERYTSVDAEQQLMAAKLTKKRRKARLDMLAAQMILKSYLESRTTRESHDA